MNILYYILCYIVQLNYPKWKPKDDEQIFNHIRLKIHNVFYFCKVNTTQLYFNYTQNVL